MRVLITGLGGELGTRVAALLEDRDDVDAIFGLDGYPPRRWLRPLSTGSSWRATAPMPRTMPPCAASLELTSLH